MGGTSGRGASFNQLDVEAIGGARGPVVPPPAAITAREVERREGVARTYVVQAIGHGGASGVEEDLLPENRRGRRL
jgi:hypothetical protein